jgi:1-acyl-sn-glycerol-3-phosphate acyltransferase
MVLAPDGVDYAWLRRATREDAMSKRIDPQSPPPEASSAAPLTADVLLQLIRELVAEARPGSDALQDLTLDSRFDRDLGLDSLARVELIARVEARLGVSLPERSFAEAESARDLLRAAGRNMPAASAELAAQAQPRAAASRDTPAQARTLLDVLHWHAQQHPQRTHIRLYEDGGEGEAITYAGLEAQAAQVAAGLQQLGLVPGQCVALMLPTGADYFYAFFGALLAGAVPVPIYPPARPSQIEDHMRRHAAILANCQAPVLITVPEAKRVAQLLKSLVPTLRRSVSLVDLTAAAPARGVLPVLRADDVALIQYTSGSTGDPKGVVLTHANLLANIRAMGQVMQADADDVFVSWLPLYHDMGLIGAWLGSLYYGALLVVMSPLAFLARPQRWLQAIHRYRGTLSASPNFGYEYCLRRIEDEALQGVDLRSWRAAFNGAEAVSPDTLEKFVQRFSARGFRAQAMMPVYGLAESSVGLAFPPPGRGARIDRIDRHRFARSGDAAPARDDDPNALRFVSGGLPLPQHQIRIVDNAGRELPERREGRLQFRGPSATSGYYRAPEKTRSLFADGWLESGDLAYMANGEVFITGRSRDIIIRAGRNIYPHEIEEAVGDIAGVRAGRVAVFGSTSAESGTERLVVLAETRSTGAAERERLHSDINARVTDLTGAPPDHIVLASPGTVLKTSSGKIRRAASRELYESGAIGRRRRSVPWQLVRLGVAAIRPRLRAAARDVRASLYAGWCWVAFGTLAPLTWLGVTLLPALRLRWRLARACSRLLARATATPLRVSGLQHIPRSGGCVLVANHASYLDAYALVAALPRPAGFIAKAELATHFFTRLPLRRLGTEFVQRFDTGQGVRDTQRLAGILNTGRALLFFPEGTFTRAPGLRPFYSGAFVVAAAAGVPVVPIAIRGTRSMLRANSWFPHRGRVYIEIGEPLDARDPAADAGGDRWRVAMALRDRSHVFILNHCGEPDAT